MKYNLLAAPFVFCVALYSQEFRGAISGVVADPSGAPVAGAKVTVIETHTGTKIQTISGSTGQYNAPFLLPGDYDIAVQIAGFKEFLRKAVHVGSDDHTVIDVRLEVGNAAQSVEVTADAPLLDSENASIGQSITTTEVEDLPINGRTPMMLASLAIGVIGTGQPGLIHPFDSAGAAGWSVGGAYAQTSELLVDGSPNATWDGRLAYSPPQDAVQEVRVKAFDTDAGFGHTGGGTLNQVMKTGTNRLHGSLFEFTQPSNLTANDFFNNAKGLQRPVTHFNQYGLSVGGPVLIPKVLDGRNKLFWFFAWETLHDSQPNANFTTVPTAAERAGDFSQVLAADGPQSQLYDPASAVQNGSTITRSPFPNNQIPASQLNPIALAYLKFYPQPNVSPTRPDGFQNFGNNATTNDDYNNELGRLDYNMNDRNRMFFNVRRTGFSQQKNNYFKNEAEGALLYRNNWGGTFDEIYTVNATNVIDARLNFTRMAEVHGLPGAGYNPTQLGFPTYIAANSDYLQVPVINFSSNTGFQALGATGASTIPSQSFQLFSDWIKIKGNHTLKFGGDLRQYRLNTFTAGNSTGTFSFSGNSWVRASSSGSSTVAMGQDFASFLLGLPYTGTYDINTFGTWYSYYSAGFVQDDWRVKHNLTVNLGIRFDHDAPYHEKYGRTVNGFDTTDPNPLAAAAMAAYAKAPVAQLSPSTFNVRGGLTFPAAGQTAVYNNTSHLVSPRAGFAWSPGRFHGKTVVRGGFGMFVSPVVISTLAITGAYSTNPITNQQGFSQSTAFTVSGSGAILPAANSLSNPFPTNFLRPAGSSQGLATFAGQAVSFLDPQASNPYSVRWDFGIEQAITPNVLLEVVYIGNHSVHLPVSVTQLNGIPRQYLSTALRRDPAETYLTNSVSNPFSGLSTSQNASTTNPAQLLARFPQFPVGDSGSGWSGSSGVLEQNLGVGSSFFDSLNVRLQKRVSGGLSFTFNYIYSKLTEFDSWLNDSDPRPEKRISPTDRPQRFVTAVSYELPFGKGRRLIGGWLLNSVYTYQVGAPITWVNGSSTSPGDYVYLGAPLNLDNRQVNGTAFNTSAFDKSTADAFNYHLRTFPTTFSNLRADGINQFDASVLKRFVVAENKYLQLRFEGFNVLNHPVFAPPNTTATNSGFGTITATANRVRTIQLGARFVF